MSRAPLPEKLAPAQWWLWDSVQITKFSHNEGSNAKEFAFLNNKEDGFIPGLTSCK